MSRKCRKFLQYLRNLWRYHVHAIHGLTQAIFQARVAFLCRNQDFFSFFVAFVSFLLLQRRATWCHVMAFDQSLVLAEAWWMIGVGFWSFPEIWAPSIHTFSRDHIFRQKTQHSFIVASGRRSFGGAQRWMKSSPQCLSALNSVWWNLQTFLFANMTVHISRSLWHWREGQCQSLGCCAWSCFVLGGTWINSTPLYS